MALTFPRVHLNGTDKDSLLRQQLDCMTALRQAHDVMAKNSLHSRDYYVIDDTAYLRARDEHLARMEAITNVIAEYEQIAEAIHAQ